MSFQKEHIVENFYEYTVMGIPVTIKEISENRFDINYSKLVGLLYENELINNDKIVNKKHKTTLFRDYIKTDKFIHHVICYLNSHNIKYNLIKENKFVSIIELCNKTNNLFYQEKGHAKIQGTYGPSDFINYILIDFKPEIILQYIIDLEHDNDVLKTRVNNYLNIIFN